MTLAARVVRRAVVEEPRTDETGQLGGHARVGVGAGLGGVAASGVAAGASIVLVDASGGDGEPPPRSAVDTSSVHPATATARGSGHHVRIVTKI